MSIAPNLVTDRFYVTVADDIFDPKAPLIIVSAGGSLIRQMNLTSKTQSIDVSTLINGMYILSYRTKGKIYSQKFVKAPR